MASEVEKSLHTVTRIPEDAAELTEQMGTKFKFWYQDRERGLSLFKEGRPETGENWAEVIACELAELMQMPHAHYRFATFRDKTGITTPSLVTSSSRLIHGNELLARFTASSGNATPTEITNNNYKKRDHTIGRVLSYFHRADELKVPNDFNTSKELNTALDIFFGYLIFDVWIANQDRHDQNWGIIRSQNGDFSLAPSYDHGSSMGRNETDEKRKIKMTSKDRGQNLEKYVSSARTALYSHHASPKSMLTGEVLTHIRATRPRAMKAWQEKIQNINQNDIISAIQKVPETMMTEISKEFTFALIQTNQKLILK